MTDTEAGALLGDLLFAAARLTRIAAYETGSSESHAIWRTLGVLQAHGDQRIGQLAGLSRVSQPTMTKLVAGLEERGYVQRVPDPDDARATRIGVAPVGEAALAAWKIELTEALHPYLDGIADDDLEALRRITRLLEDRVERGIRNTSQKAQRKER